LGLYTIEDEKYLKIVVTIDEKKVSSQKKKINDIVDFIEIMKDNYKYENYPESSQ